MFCRHRFVDGWGKRGKQCFGGDAWGGGMVGGRGGLRVRAREGQREVCLCICFCCAGRCASDDDSSAMSLSVIRVRSRAACACCERFVRMRSRRQSALSTWSWSSLKPAWPVCRGHAYTRAPVSMHRFAVDAPPAVRGSAYQHVGPALRSGLQTHCPCGQVSESS